MNCLFPTIAGQIAMSGADKQQKVVDIFSRDPLILDQRHGPTSLVDRLLSDPLQRHAMLIVVDGLDECDNSFGQSRALSDIHDLLYADHQVLPVRFLITSRPYPHIKEWFEGPGITTEMSTCISLDVVDGVDQDVVHFLQREFARIGHSNGRKDTLQAVREPWPSVDILQRLAIESGGSFYYAATVVNYVDVPRFSTVRLDRILSTEISRSTSTNLSGLDKLYFCILDQLSVSDLTIIKRILGFSLFPDFFREPVNVLQIPELLGLSPENMMSRLNDLRSVIHFKQCVTGKYFRIIPPFEDFLSNRDLSQEYHIDCHEWQEDTLRDMLRSESARPGYLGRMGYALYHPHSCPELLLLNSFVKIVPCKHRG